MGLREHLTLPKNPPATVPSLRLEQYENRQDICAKVGGSASAVLTVLVIAVAATDFSKDAPGWLRALTIVLLIAGALSIGRAWVGFHWKAVELERRIGRPAAVPRLAEPKSKKHKKGRKHEKGEEGTTQTVPPAAADPDQHTVDAWPASYEAWWTIGLYLLLLDLISLATLTVWSVV